LSTTYAEVHLIKQSTLEDKLTFCRIESAKQVFNFGNSSIYTISPKLTREGAFAFATMCGIKRFLTRRREAARRGSLPRITTVSPSTATDVEAVQAARFTSERFNGHKCTSGLTVPLPTRLTVTKVGIALAPATPYVHALEGAAVSYLELNATTVLAKPESEDGAKQATPQSPRV